MMGYQIVFPINEKFLVKEVDKTIVLPNCKCMNNGSNQKFCSQCGKRNNQQKRQRYNIFNKILMIKDASLEVDPQNLYFYKFGPFHMESGSDHNIQNIILGGSKNNISLAPTRICTK